MRFKQTRDITIIAAFIAIGIVLPFLTGSIPEIGKRLLPMHLVALLCGMFYGPTKGCLVGFVTPLLRSLLFSTPVLFPSAIAMSLELATYGLILGILYNRKHNIYFALLLAMLFGRVIWGLSMLILLGVQSKFFTWEAFVAGAFINALPGIILQVILIPVLARIWKEMWSNHAV